MRRFGVAAAAIVVALGAALVSTAVSAQIGGRPTRPHVTPPKGAPRQVIFKYCTSCHGIDGTFKGNRHLVFPDNTQRTSNMLLSILHLYGIDQNKIGTSTGRLEPLEMV